MTSRNSIEKENRILSQIHFLEYMSPLLSLEPLDQDDTCQFTLDLQDPAFRSEEYEDMKEYVSENSDQLPDLQISDGFVYKKMEHSSGISDILDQRTWKLWIPSALRQNLNRSAHDSPNKSHGGISKTLHWLHERYFLSYMAENVRNFRKKCEKCSEFKSPNTTLKTPFGKTFQVQKPFQHIYADFLEPYPRSKKGHTKIFIVLDQLTKFIMLEPIPTSKNSLIINYLKDRVFNVFGAPETFFSDNGPEFKSKEFEKFIEAYGIIHLDTLKYHAQANASERANRSIIEAMGCYIKDLDHST